MSRPFLPMLVFGLLASNLLPAADSPNPEAGFPPSISYPKAGVTWQPAEDERRAWVGTTARFHGRVIDNHAQPVAGAEIDCQPNVNPWQGPLRRTLVQSAADGSFYFEAPHAPVVAFTVTALGHRPTTRSFGTFLFLPPPKSLPAAMIAGMTRQTSTSAERPVLFVVENRARGEAVGTGIAQGMLDGDQAFSVGGGRRPEHRLVFHHHSDIKAPKAIGQPGVDSGWEVEITAEGGGLQVCWRPEPMTFDAPETGYQKSVRLKFEAANQNVSVPAPVRAVYYVKFDDSTYGLLEVVLKQTGHHPVAQTRSWFNLSGGRHLPCDPDVIMDAGEVGLGK